MAEWRAIAGFDGYEVSADGQIRSWWMTSRWGRKRRIAPHVLATRWRGGYLAVTISVDGKKHAVPVHIATCEAFHGSRPNGMWALHRNGDRENNTSRNLYWGTPLENAADRDRHGNTGRGEKNPNARLKKADVARIRQDYRAGKATQVQLAEQHGVRQAHISEIVLGKCWREVNV